MELQQTAIHWSIMDFIYICLHLPVLQRRQPAELHHHDRRRSYSRRRHCSRLHLHRENRQMHMLQALVHRRRPEEYWIQFGFNANHSRIHETKSTFNDLLYSLVPSFCVTLLFLKETAVNWCFGLQFVKLLYCLQTSIPLCMNFATQPISFGSIFCVKRIRTHKITVKGHTKNRETHPKWTINMSENQIINLFIEIRW